MEDALFDHLSSGGTVITATRRLSRELVAQYDARQLAAGRNAWQGADVMPWESWLRRTADELQPTLPTPRLILSDRQSVALWRRAIDEDIGLQQESTASLWNGEATAREAWRAWRRVNDWRLDMDAVRHSSHSDHRAWCRWAAAVTSKCEAEGWLDSANLGNLLQKHIDLVPRKRLWLTGFVVLDASQLALLQSLEEEGSEWHLQRPVESVSPEPCCAVYETESAQWLGAGRWARELVSDDPSCRVAIVVPNLDRCRSAVEYALRQALCPRDLTHPADSSQRPFHLSLGRPLLDYDGVQAAMMLMAQCAAPRIAAESIGTLLRSPWLAGYQREAAARSTFVQRQVRWLAYRISIEELCDLLEQAGDCPLLLETLRGVIEWRNTRPESTHFRGWSEWLAKLLGHLGWPGDSAPGSDNFQTVEAFRDQLNGLSEMDLVEPPGDCSRALHFLRNRLAAQIFQPEAHEAPVQVMGVLEAMGLHFDAVWFGGLIEDVWPAGATPSPFLPTPLQREAGIPQASVEGNATLARLQLARIQASTGTLCLSWFRYDGEVGMTPSPLLAGYESQVDAVKPATTVATQLASRRPILETVADDAGPPLAQSEQVAGGTSLVRAQSACPRGAFLRYRLGGEPPETIEQGLDPAQRGSLVHRLLELVWADIGDSAALSRLDDDGLGDIVREHVGEQSRRYFYQSGCGRRFFELQNRWLTRTLMAWFAVERLRTVPFTVVGREEKATLSLSGLELGLKIDRIDRFDDGSLGLIDYKTGGTLSVADWGEARPNEPQLPLYLLSQTDPSHPVSMIAFAHVRLGDCRLVGLTQSAVVAAEPKPLNLSEVDSHRVMRKKMTGWDDLVEHVEESMHQLGAEFMSGLATIDPRNHGLCRNCTTPAFCRSGNQITEPVELIDGEFADSQGGEQFEGWAS